MTGKYLLCTQGGGDTRKNFDRDARATLLGLKPDNLLFFGLLGLFFGG